MNIATLFKLPKLKKANQLNKKNSSQIYHKMKFSKNM